jgi:Pentapeptide repeats (8 copies)
MILGIEMKIAIKHKFTNEILCEFEAVDIKDCLEKAVKRDANLSYANLSYANLIGANLSDANLSYANLIGANLSDANLSYANLIGANLSDANLSGANLSGAYLRGANLSYANLIGANLSDANLSGANLSGAYLRGAYLRGANLSGANLSQFKSDIFDVLLRAPNEVKGLKQSLLDGKVDGSVYEGDCACLVGTLANIRQCDYKLIGNGISPDASRPAEQWFMLIKKGDTPETNNVSKITVEWIDEFLSLLELAKS